MASPKRILALDGGGIRGIFSLQVLARIEEIFRRRRGRPGLVLRDEFDYFAGTSTGGIIATCLAWGMSVAEIDDLYTRFGTAMFTKSGWFDRYWKSKYSAAAISRFFQDRFREDDGSPALLGTDRFRSGGRLTYLLLVMRNASTGSAWPVCNNPDALYNDESLPDCNLRVPLWQLLRASTAAPTFFPPEEITFPGCPPQIFLDGGITPYNNPALIAFFMATLPAYRLGWPTGRDRLQLVSIGTGRTRERLPDKVAREIHLLDHAKYVPTALMGSIAQQQDFLCRVLGHGLVGDTIDTEVGALMPSGLMDAPEKKFTYLRYNRLIDAAQVAAIERGTGLRFTLDNLGLLEPLRELGRAYAAEHVREQDLLPEPRPDAAVPRPAYA
jgi:uncharacterized protein